MIYIKAGTWPSFYVGTGEAQMKRLDWMTVAWSAWTAFVFAALVYVAFFAR